MDSWAVYTGKSIWVGLRVIVQAVIVTLMKKNNAQNLKNIY